MAGMREAWRRRALGLATLFGRPRGFFAPYRYAATVARPGPYPALEAAFAAAEPALRRVGLRIAAESGRLARFDGPPPRPRWGQSWFPRLDGAAAVAIVGEARPDRVIEVGSGHSTRFLAAAMAGHGRLVAIDPAPRAALAGLGVDWRRRVLAEADLGEFAALGPGDVAFFDSSHLLWEGTDVDLILNRILPVLAPGVLVHLHDVLLPDPYPEDWAWRGYSEQLGLAGWILGGAYEVVWASHYAATRLGAGDWPGVAALPLPAGARETSLWLRRAGLAGGAGLR